MLQHLCMGRTDAGERDLREGLNKEEERIWRICLSCKVKDTGTSVQVLLQVLLNGLDKNLQYTKFGV